MPSQDDIDREFGVDSGIVYDELVPMLKRCLGDKYVSDHDDVDAAELRAVIESTLTFLESRDTTVRETY